MNRLVAQASRHGVLPASSPSVSLDEGPVGETLPELAAVDGCVTPRRFKVSMRGKNPVEISTDATIGAQDRERPKANLFCNCGTNFSVATSDDRCPGSRIPDE